MYHEKWFDVPGGGSRKAVLRRDQLLTERHRLGQKTAAWLATFDPADAAQPPRLYCA